jgi:hypothetical protein
MVQLWASLSTMAFFFTLCQTPGITDFTSAALVEDCTLYCLIVHALALVWVEAYATLLAHMNLIHLPVLSN